MKTVMIASLAVLLPLQAATAAGTGAKQVPRAVAGQKIDNGLGELPHYRLWADPSGKNPMGAAKAAKAVKSAKAPAEGEVKAAASTSTRVAALK